MSLDYVWQQWVSYINYLSVHIERDKKLSFKIDATRQVFFAACNRIYAQSRLPDEIIRLKLQENQCLPIFSHAVAAINLNGMQ
jgi:hypothetical protein